MILRALVLFTAAGQVLAPALAAPAFSAANIEAKVALESSVEKRLESVLRKMLGTDDIIVIVNAELLSQAQRQEKSEEVLPGVPVKETPAVAPLEVSSVRCIGVTIYADQNLAEADLALMRKAVEGIIGLKRERGDTLVFEKMSLQKEAAGAKPKWPGLADFLTPARLLSLFWLAVACLFLFFFQRSIHPFLSVFKEVANNLKSNADIGSNLNRTDFESRNGMEMTKQPAAGPAERNGNATASRELPFAFIGPRDLPTLSILLRGQSPQAAAAIMHYLPPELASQALAGMKPETRHQVVTRMSQAVLLNHAEVRKLEENILTKIDYMTGGEERLLEVLNEAPMRLQSEIMNALRQKDPAMCKRVQQRIILLEDIAWLSEADLMALSRQVPVRSMAAALKFSEPLKQQVMPKLKTGLGEWLAQEIEFSPEVSEEAAQWEIRRVLKALSQLIKEGKIILNRNGGGA
ncbi:MAG: hypothetical protein A3J74_07485 [Elusimicrobia bacterium RIFCSPHIGHO2_02_FULL_57_9]|nr:MAG: hypothetical protein A3J74_07485 [Elusimicrobia bacterium RIFCSPHIGHO2_02_FULL_57_9]